jgi:F420-dependent oxidoreductase-like protein
MKIGLQIYNFDWPGSPENTGPKLAEIAKTADNAGFYSLWLMDHFFQVGHGSFGPPEAPMLEGYTTLSYMAAVTERIKLGLMVTGNIYRHPGILIKTVTTLDILSGGRAYLGIGTGWYEREAKGLGVPLPSTGSEWFERLEETLQIAKHMWSGDKSPFMGKYYQLYEPMNHPQPLSKPHPPILIGGEGEVKTLRLVAKYGNACNFHFGTPLRDFEYPASLKDRYDRLEEIAARKFAKLEEHCEKIGRSCDDIERTGLGTIKLAPDAMDSNDVISLCERLAKIGFYHVIFNMPNVHEIKPIEVVGREVIPQVTDM